MLFRIGMAGESEIVQPPRQILARKPRYPTGRAGAVRHSRIGRCADLGILSAIENQPAMERRNEAPIVGYLGFRAEIFPNRCTNCARKGRAAEPLSFPFSLLPIPFSHSHLTPEADSKSSKTSLPKKCLLKVIGRAQAPRMRFAPGQPDRIAK